MTAAKEFRLKKKLAYAYEFGLHCVSDKDLTEFLARGWLIVTGNPLEVFTEEGIKVAKEYIEEC